ncbi:hypothetical protein [Rosistilla oblonga]|uniref:hypothetical protein n=1 Tax=Rosistilla oblonga TaxID=2527990 RepID=UPI0011A690BA|nr:hypothetical protein [Rosistilla oblonga]
MTVFLGLAMWCFVWLNMSAPTEEQLQRELEQQELIEDMERRKQENMKAIVAAKRFVLSKLKSPSTARFPWGSDEYNVVSSHDGKEWTVSSHVDAQNSFGAM